MTDEYNDCLRQWAADRLGIPVERVETVKIEHDEGYYYSSLTWEDESWSAVVTGWDVHSPDMLKSLREMALRHSRDRHLVTSYSAAYERMADRATIYLDGDEFGPVLNAVLSHVGKEIPPYTPRGEA